MKAIIAVFFLSGFVFGAGVLWGWVLHLGKAEVPTCRTLPASPAMLVLIDAHQAFAHP